MEINKNETEGCQKDDFKLNISETAQPFEIVNAYAMLKSRIDYELLDEGINDDRRELLNNKKEKARMECILYLKNNLPDTFNSFTGDEYDEQSYDTYSCSCLCDESDHLNGTCDCSCRNDSCANSCENPDQNNQFQKQIAGDQETLQEASQEPDKNLEVSKISSTDADSFSSNKDILENKCDAKVCQTEDDLHLSNASCNKVHLSQEPSDKSNHKLTPAEEERLEKKGCFSIFKWFLCLHK